MHDDHVRIRHGERADSDHSRRSADAEARPAIWTVACGTRSFVAASVTRSRCHRRPLRLQSGPPASSAPPSLSQHTVWSGMVEAFLEDELSCIRVSLATETIRTGRPGAWPSFRTVVAHVGQQPRQTRSSEHTYRPRIPQWSTRTVHAIVCLARQAKNEVPLRAHSAGVSAAPTVRCTGHLSSR